MNIAVYGASGHTARFVLAELIGRSHTPIAIGRDRGRLEAALAGVDPAIEARVAALDSPASLDRALAGSDAVINCAGPFLDTARPLVEAALRAGIHYFDVTAEQGSASATLEAFDAPARERGVVVVPAAGFYGGLADLLATAAMREWREADSIDVAIALDSWLPTRGTRLTGERNTAPRLVYSQGKLVELTPSARAPWQFAEPFGTQEIAEIPFTETILMARHLRVHEIHNYLNQSSLRDVRNPDTPQPVAADESGRSDQRFLIEVVVRRGNQERRIAAEGRDIYAVTAPIVVEAAERACNGRTDRAGALALGELGDASEVLAALAAARFSSAIAVHDASLGQVVRR